MSSMLRRAFIFAFAVLLALPASTALAADTTRPTVSGVSPTSATVGNQIMFTATYADDDSGVEVCRLYVEFANQGDMTLANGVASLPYTFVSGGVYTVFVHCRDTAGNAANGANTAVVVSTSGGGSGDSTPPTVGAISPTSAQVDAAVLFQASVGDAASCRLIVNGFDRGDMAISSSIANRSHTFDEIGTAQVYAQCADASGNAGAGPVMIVTVSEAAPPPVVVPPPAPTVTPGLVKLACPEGSTASHPCRAVYYRSTDGARHAFPNEKIYFTWYADFSGVETVSASAMAALPLSLNVTYRPGVRMIKFVTDNKVYAVGRAGLLRWVASESLAASLYGANWNTKIDDLSDAFVSDYSFGPEITNASEYSPSAQTAGTATIDANF